MKRKQNWREVAYSFTIAFKVNCINVWMQQFRCCSSFGLVQVNFIRLYAEKNSNEKNARRKRVKKTSRFDFQQLDWKYDSSSPNCQLPLTLPFIVISSLSRCVCVCVSLSLLDAISLLLLDRKFQKTSTKSDSQNINTTIKKKLKLITAKDVCNVQRKREKQMNSTTVIQIN